MKDQDKETFRKSSLQIASSIKDAIVSSGEKLTHLGNMMPMAILGGLAINVAGTLVATFGFKEKKAEEFKTLVLEFMRDLKESEDER